MARLQPLFLVPLLLLAGAGRGDVVDRKGRYSSLLLADDQSLSEEKLNQLNRAFNQPLVDKTSNWSSAPTEKNESIPQLGYDAAIGAARGYDTDTDDEDDEKIVLNKNNPSWPRSRKLWWQLSRFRSAGGFFGFDWSTLTSIAKFLAGFMGNDVADDDVEPPSSGVKYKDHQLLRITPKTQKEVEFLEELKDSEPDDVKFWTFPAKDKNTDILISPSMINDVKEYLLEKKVEFTVLIQDLQQVIKSQNPRTPKERRQDVWPVTKHPMTWKRYHRYDDIMQYLDYLESEYPDLVKVQSIGKSFEDRDLKIIKISSGKKSKTNEPKPAIWIDAGMHAREWISTAVATYIINQLVERSDNYTRLLDMTDWIIMPVANPDGYEFTHTEDRLWRKTRSTQDGDTDAGRQGGGFMHMLNHYTKWLFGSCEGVDPNRNFDVHWGEREIAGASLDPCHDTYAGTRAFSELETKAIAEYILKNKKNIRTYLTLHSYSQMLLVPWGFTNLKPPDFDTLMNVATKAKKAMAKVHGTEYRVGPAAELLYPTTGSSDDWAKAKAGIKYAYTLELRDRGQFGFLLPASQIMPTARETWAGVRVIARMSAANPN